MPVIDAKRKQNEIISNASIVKKMIEDYKFLIKNKNEKAKEFRELLRKELLSQNTNHKIFEIEYIISKQNSILRKLQNMTAGPWVIYLLKEISKQFGILKNPGKQKNPAGALVDSILLEKKDLDELEKNEKNRNEKIIKVKIPTFLEELRTPWMQGVNSRIQEGIRFSSQLFEYKPGCFRIIEYMSGGAGTIISKDIPKQEAEIFQNIKKKEYYPPNKEADLSKLKSFLINKSINLKIKDVYISEQAVTQTLEIMELLPENHLRNSHFKELILGGWGGGAAKGSEYDKPTVHIFSFAIDGARRNFLCMLLHEIGHSFFSYITSESPSLKKRMELLFKNLDLSHFRNLAIDFIFGKSSRLTQISSSASEFYAEFYLWYVVQGTRIKIFAESLEQTQKDLIIEIYDIYKENFGIEYV